MVIGTVMGADASDGGDTLGAPGPPAAEASTGGYAGLQVGSSCESASAVSVAPDVISLTSPLDACLDACLEGFGEGVRGGDG